MSAASNTASTEEWPPFDEAEQRDWYTPNYVSDPSLRSDGIALYVDCKGVITTPMRTRFIAILGEELAELGDVQVRGL